jgi:hypothetical protein
VGDRSKRKTAGRKRSGGEKVKFLAILPAVDIKAMKLRAIERGVTASEILEEAVAAWLKLNRGAAPKLPEKVPSSEKRQFLSQMDARLIKQIKVMAIDWKTSASALAGQAVAEWLGRHNERSQTETT